MSRDVIHHALGTYRPTAPEHAALVSKAHASGFEEEHFYVGDEVISRCGSVAGVILSMSGEGALVSWSCRGKSVETVDHLTHTEHTTT